MPEETLRQVRQQVKLLRRIAVGALLAWALIATVGFGVSTILQLHTNSAANSANVAAKNSDRASNAATRAANSAISAATRLRDAQVAGCYRQNIRLAALNRNAYASYKVNSLFAKDLLIPHKHQSRQQRQLVQHFYHRLIDDVNTVTWTPLNPDCRFDPTATPLPNTFGNKLPTRVDLHPSRTDLIGAKVIKR